MKVAMVATQVATMADSKSIPAALITTGCTTIM
jgi:hypothetical protein